MSDYMVRATAAGAMVRLFVCSSKELVEEARKIHNTTPVVTAALGRLLTAGAMMGSMLKGEKDLLTIQIKSSGPIGGMTVTATSDGMVKGYPIHADVELPLKANGKLDVGTGMGIGVMNVIKDMGLKEPYVGQTVLQTGEIGDDLTYYFATSEQIPSSVGVGVLIDRDYSVKHAGGFIVQLMPFATDEVISKLEENLGKITSVTSMFEEGMTVEDITAKIFDGMDYEIMDTTDIGYQCNCSKEKVTKAIISIGKKDIKEMIDDNKPIEVNCHFCNTNYVFSVDELKAML
ncbi:MAG: Hsp33 family molecular chaperone HslO [Lachnospiraceae bacterium]|nr:Hsp33 family molecular chaperone HslO [Lachnospiraceae bacterium]